MSDHKSNESTYSKQAQNIGMGTDLLPTSNPVIVYAYDNINIPVVVRGPGFQSKSSGTAAEISYQEPGDTGESGGKNTRELKPENNED
jgi:hypothetical protein